MGCIGALEPTAKMVTRELGRKTHNPDLAFDYSGLWAYDLAGRLARWTGLTAGEQMSR